MSIQQVEISNPDYGFDDKLMLVTAHSSALQGRGNISIYNAYSASQDLPVIILMHGVYGNHWVWMQLGGVHEVYNRMREQGLGEFVLVMPEDGSYYAGSGYLPLRGADYDAWISDDLLTTVKSACDSVTENSRVYISGLSMGGYGALRLGAKHADRFSGISGHSSITELSEIQQFVEEDMSHYELSEKADPNESDIVYWLEKNNDKLPPLRFDCGEDDQLFDGNLRFKSRLETANIPFEFSQNPGAHEWSYWHRHVEDTFEFFDKIEERSQSS